MKEAAIKKEEVVRQTVVESDKEEMIKEAVIQKTPKKTDVTWGVRVPEKLKNELNTLMREVDVSGKEFVEMLISSYRLEEAKRNGNLYESDARELQLLLKRVQAIFANMIERSQTEKEGEQSKLEQIEETHQAEIEKLSKQRTELSKALGTAKAQYNEVSRSEKALKKELEEAKKQLSQQKIQLENNTLLYKKFEEETLELKKQLNLLQPVKEQLSEVQKEYHSLKTTYKEQEEQLKINRQTISQITQEKEALKTFYEQELKNMKMQYELQLKNSTLEAELTAEKKVSLLKEQIVKLEKANQELQKTKASS